MRRVALLTVVGAVLGVVLALLVHGAQHSSTCSSAGPGGSNGCTSRPGLSGLLVGLMATGGGIGLLCGAAWESEHRRRIS